MLKSSSRRKEREKALQTLYRLDIFGAGGAGGAGAGAKAAKVGSSKGGTLATSSESGESGSYAHTVSEGVISNLTEINRLIDKSSKNWSLARMAVVDRNILRIAVYELLYHGDIPCKVVMDEAVELANRFGAENSSSFINGVIDSAYKEILSRRRPSMRDMGQ